VKAIRQRGCCWPRFDFLRQEDEWSEAEWMGLIGNSLNSSSDGAAELSWRTWAIARMPNETRRPQCLDYQTIEFR
jgi:hypothetical protein